MKVFRLPTKEEPFYEVEYVPGGGLDLNENLKLNGAIWQINTVSITSTSERITYILEYLGDV